MRRSCCEFMGREGEGNKTIKEGERQTSRGDQKKGNESQGAAVEKIM